ncbi:unnamed protein product [Prorocentrum cordatum]|uniref:Uncharacterized protein n=1 Tax=Prorocentrum cordatum TaxID=2364126 RepID=A0ABN9RRM2_9DINO|nr:unnamed protein product [Polarella glacialis]
MRGLLDYRRDPIARRYILLAGLVDALPTWLVDDLVPVLLPNSSLTIPLNASVQLQAVGLFNVTLFDLDRWTKLRPLWLNEGSLFTWESSAALDLLEVEVCGGLVLNTGTQGVAHEVAVCALLALAQPTVDLGLVVAMRSDRMCEVWGSVLRSSAGCALYPLFFAEDASGVRLSHLRIGIEGYRLEALSASGILLPGLEERLLRELRGLLEANATERLVTAQLPTAISAGLRDALNMAAPRELPRRQVCDWARHPARLERPNGSLLEASRVCFVNNGGFDLRFRLHDCAAHRSTDYSPVYPVDRVQCMDAGAIGGAAVPAGRAVRPGVQVLAGLHELPEPALLYSANASTAGFVCSGSTLRYRCDLASLAPAQGAPEAQSVCVLNHAAAVLSADALDALAGRSLGHTGEFAVDQMRCVDLAEAGAEQGRAVAVEVKAAGGRRTQAEPALAYRRGGVQIVYRCTGTTLSLACRLLGAEGGGGAEPVGAAVSLSRAACALGAAAGGLALGAAALGGAGRAGGSAAARRGGGPRQPGRSGAEGLLGLAEGSDLGGPDCHTALDGEYCYSAVLWGMQQGLTEKPQDYPGLGLESGFRDFQRVLHARGVGDCPEPCADEGAQRPPTSVAAAERCAFDYNGGPEALCFCQLAGNAACGASDCSCPEGCDVAWNHSATVTFRNKNEASGCDATTGLLATPAVVLPRRGVPADVVSQAHARPARGDAAGGPRGLPGARGGGGHRLAVHPRGPRGEHRVAPPAHVLRRRQPGRAARRQRRRLVRPDDDGRSGRPARGGGRQVGRRAVRPSPQPAPDELRGARVREARPGGPVLLPRGVRAGGRLLRRLRQGVRAVAGAWAPDPRCWRGVLAHALPRASSLLRPRGGAGPSSLPAGLGSGRWARAASWGRLAGRLWEALGNPAL